ncbi:MAG: phosphatase PAP2 family protein [Myxococcaceae bacterium]
MVISTGTAVAALYLVLFARWVPGWYQSAVVFAGLSLGPPVIRMVGRRFPRFARITDFMGGFWLIPAAGLAHVYFSPVVDAFNPRLYDAKLAFADLRIFGQAPGSILAERLGPWGIELSLVCYYLYYVWPIVIGLALFFRNRKNRRIFDEYILALALFFTANFILYALVPAIGPRFFLFAELGRPVQGLFLTPMLDSMMRAASFTRDCFPSGHTGITLTVMTYAFFHQRKLFYMLLPFVVGLLCGTLVGRFHYGIDLLCAVPLCIVCVKTAAALVKARPQGVVVPGQVFALRAT